MKVKYRFTYHGTDNMLKFKKKLSTMKQELFSSQNTTFLNKF